MLRETEAQEHFCNSTCQGTAADDVPEVLDGWEVQAAPRLHQEHVPLQHLRKTPEEENKSRGARGCNLAELGTKQSTVLLVGDMWEPPSLREGPVLHTPHVSAGAETAMPSAPGILPARLAGWGHGVGCEQVRSIVHPSAPQSSGASPSSLVTPAVPCIAGEV